MITDSSEYDVRYTKPEDELPLRSFLTSPGMMHHFPISNAQEMEESVKCWMGFAKFHCGLTATLRDVPCGMGILFLMPYRKVAHQGLFKVIVDPKLQHQGIGSSLIKNLKNLAKNHFRLELLQIEVYEGNPIVHLLKEQGFIQLLRQERFVNEGGQYRARMLWECAL